MNFRKQLNYYISSIVLISTFSGCGEDSTNLKQNNNEEITTNSQKLYLKEKTEYSSDGKVKTTIYKYDSNHHLIYDGCQNTYDNKNRITSIICKNRKSIYHYEGDRLSKYELYKNGQISGKWSILEWNNEKPKKVQWQIKTKNSWTTTILTFSHTGYNETRVKNKMILANGATYTSKIEQTFDKKKIPNDSSRNMFGGYATFVKDGYLGGFSRNNVIKQRISSINKLTNEPRTITVNYEITYNSSGYPTKIDTYMSNDTHSYIIYEYVELD